ncbi:MAG: hypothetical protein UR94_C0023G0003 [Parcubacteria group bacterium GW2011_GWA2_36_10]|nr:MAG: hypothetical protein UR94_C0023G0003 [Parcubacteria group bacterium GW2011_GWA2_36_10]
MYNKIKNIFRLRSRQAGFTLLEMLIALSVISVGVMAAFTLSTANLNTAKANYSRVLAANLAREGLEAVRNIRDTNWLKIQANADCGATLCTWDNNLDQGTSTISYDSGDDLGTLINTSDISACFADKSCILKIKNDTGYNIYTHSGGDETNIARLIILKAICRDSDDTLAIQNSSDENCGATFEEKVGLQVTSQVYWQDFNKSHTLEAVEELYNWREYEN